MWQCTGYVGLDLVEHGEFQNDIISSALTTPVHVLVSFYVGSSPLRPLQPLPSCLSILVTKKAIQSLSNLFEYLRLMRALSASTRLVVSSRKPSFRPLGTDYAQGLLASLCKWNLIDCRFLCHFLSWYAG